MVKTTVTLSLDYDTKKEVQRILESKGIRMSFCVEQYFRKLIEDELKGGQSDNGIFG